MYELQLIKKNMFFTEASQMILLRRTTFLISSESNEFSTGIPRAVLHQQQTIGSAGAGKIQEGAIPRLPLSVPYRESMLQSE